MHGITETSGMMPPEYAKNVRKQRDMSGKNAARKSADKDAVPEEKDDAHSGNGYGHQSGEDLNDVAQNGAVQPSLGNLNQDTQDLVDETQEEIETEKIEHFDDPPDYKEDTAWRPYVVTDGAQYWCIDGWVLVEKAKAEGRTAVLCHVLQRPDCSPERLALEKTALRVAPRVRGGRYAEYIRNVTRVWGMLLRSKKDLRAFSHGGARRGPAYASNREEDLIAILAGRLGKEREKIATCLSYGRYLAADALETLVQKNAPRRFFEQAQSHKRKLIDELKHAQESDVDIEEKVSAKVLGWLEEFAVSGTINNGVEDNRPESREPSQESSQATEARQEAQPALTQRASRLQRPSSPTDFQHHTPQEEPEDEGVAEPETLESMVLEAKACTGEFDMAITNESLTPATFAESVRIAVAKLAQIHVRAQRLCQEA